MAMATVALVLLVRTGLGAYFEPRLAEAGLSSVPVLADLAAALAYWLSAARLTKTPPIVGGATVPPEILP